MCPHLRNDGQGVCCRARQSSTASSWSRPVGFPRVLHPVPLQQRIDDAVGELRRAMPEGGAERLYRIGEIIIEGVYEGDLGAWRARGRKSASLRALCRRDDLPLSASSIYRGLAIYELVTTSGVSTWKHLKPAHFRAIEQAAEERRVELLRHACAVDITPNALARLARSRDEAGAPRRRGRPRTDPLVRAMRKLGQAAAEVRKAADEAGERAPPEVGAALARVAAMLGNVASGLGGSACRSGKRPQGVPQSSG